MNELNVTSRKEDLRLLCRETMTMMIVINAIVERSAKMCLEEIEEYIRLKLLKSKHKQALLKRKKEKIKKRLVRKSQKRIKKFMR